MSQIITIVHLYPREMNIYGDLGNVLALQRRLEWRGYGAKVISVRVGQEIDLAQADIIFGGGGQDRGQSLVAADLQERGEELRRLVTDGLPMLLVCGLYQLFGASFTTSFGEKLQGIGVFDAQTVAGSMRMIGNVTLKSQFGRLVGFENHSGATTLSAGQEALGQIVKGYGNKPKAGHEGAIAHNSIGTYLHGPVLPQNPALADWLILKALERKYQITELESLDDTLEHQAATAAAQRPQ